MFCRLGLSPRADQPNTSRKPSRHDGYSSLSPAPTWPWRCWLREAGCRSTRSEYPAGPQPPPQTCAAAEGRPGARPSTAATRPGGGLVVHDVVDAWASSVDRLYSDRHRVADVNKRIPAGALADNRRVARLHRSQVKRGWIWRCSRISSPASNSRSRTANPGARGTVRHDPQAWRREPIAERADAVPLSRRAGLRRGR